MKKTNLKLILLAVFLFLIPIVFSQSPLDRIYEYNQEQAVYYLQNLSFFVAFVGGMISVLLPCTLAILPAFFAYTFKERKEITKMTFVFFLGFSLIFMLLGVFAAAIGQTITSIQVADTKLLIIIAGIFLIGFGIMTMLGKGFNFISINKKTGHDIFGVFTFGLLFGLGWSACLGPILAGILLIASTFHNYFYSAALLFFYSLGLFVPLFLISILFDKFNLTQVPWIKGREFEVKIFGKTFFIHTTKIIAGVLLIASGTVFIVFNGTSVINSLDPLRTSVYAYIFEEKVFKIPNIDIIGLFALVLLAGLVGYFILKKPKHNSTDETPK
ncbi:MAG TPA: cytochrome c biogenesis CcdA family protein [Candidatus Nanoarchaeia archaeon]|nr:cytochrome c biogenesis CcdA family protein [Candidatus Nanoarchaeia archaeon]